MVSLLQLLRHRPRTQHMRDGHHSGDKLGRRVIYATKERQIGTQSDLFGKCCRIVDL
jgi:hypothetical protein